MKPKSLKGTHTHKHTHSVTTLTTIFTSKEMYTLKTLIIEHEKSNISKRVRRVTNWHANVVCNDSIKLTDASELKSPTYEIKWIIIFASRALLVNWKHRNRAGWFGWKDCLRDERLKRFLCIFQKFFFAQTLIENYYLFSETFSPAALFKNVIRNWFLRL